MYSGKEVMYAIRRRILQIVIISVLFLLSPLQGNIATAIDMSGNLNSGPYIDNVVYKVETDSIKAILALQAGTIQMDTSFFDPVHYDALDADPDISIYKATRNGYGHITFNCRDPPLNETVLRRAFAFAFDKVLTNAIICDGWGREHDSLVPYPMCWCIEDELPWHYYTVQPEIGNALLNTSGLFPYGPDGWRTYKGQPIDPIEFENNLACECASRYISTVAVDALLSLDIPAVKKHALPSDYLSRLDQHGAYDMVFSGAYNFYGNDITELGDRYYSANANREGLNPSNFRNSTFDRCLPQFWNGTTYEEVYNASRWMQLILHEQVPLLVIYENVYNQAYRIDTFTGQVPDFYEYISGPLMLRHVHLIEGSTPTNFVTGGTFTISIRKSPDTFNIYVTDSAYTHTILNEMWTSLYIYGPDGRPLPYLVNKLTTETHVDNPTVPVNHTRFIIDIIQNATWSDGVPLTAYDVAFTFVYDLESRLFGNTRTIDLGALRAVYAPNNYQVVFEFASESYWHFNTFAFQYIIPEHIFNNKTGIGYAGWEEWNPVFDPGDPHVTSGPFTLTDFKSGEYYNLSFNPSFAYAVLHDVDTTPTPTDNSTYPSLYEYYLAVFVGGASTSISIVMVSEVIRLKWNKKK